jgi:hypothetical protein
MNKIAHSIEDYSLSNLKELEAKAIHIIREVASEFENPVMLYSIGKDSSVMVRLAEKAFHPVTNNTIAVGMIIDKMSSDELPTRITDIDKRKIDSGIGLISSREYEKRYN